MSATPQSARAGWDSPQVLPRPAPPLPAALERHDPLQLLLAFARMHEQAVARRRQHHSGAPETPPDEYFGLDEVLRLVAVRAAAITAADGIAVALASEDGIVCRASFGRISPNPGVLLDPHSGFSGACLRHGQTVRCDDSETDSRVNRQACRSLGARSMVAVPLTAKGRVVGLLEAFSSEPLGFNESSVGRLNLLGELVLAAMHPAEKDRLVQLARQILSEPPQPEPERPAETRGTFTEEAASAPAAFDSDLAGPPVGEALVAAILDQAEAEASTPPSQSSSIAEDTPIPAPAAGIQEVELELRSQLPKWVYEQDVTPAAPSSDDVGPKAELIAQLATATWKRQTLQPGLVDAVARETGFSKKMVSNILKKSVLVARRDHGYSLQTIEKIKRSGIRLGWSRRSWSGEACQVCSARDEQLSALWTYIIQKRREQKQRLKETNWEVGYVAVAEANDLVDRVEEELAKIIEKPRVRRNSLTNHNSPEAAARDDGLGANNAADAAKE